MQPAFDLDKNKYAYERNQVIDGRIMEIFGVGEGTRMTSKEFCRLARQKLSPEVVGEIWKEQKMEIIKKRTGFLLTGMEKYLTKEE